jgi:signal peptidase I
VTALSPQLVTTSSGRARRSFRALRAASMSLVLGLATGLAVALVWSVPFGGHALIEMSGSMSPAIETGDVVVITAISPLEARVGDVITFNDPERKSRLLTHRVHTLRVAGDSVEFVTQGDANTTRERWRIAADGTIGRTAYRIPRLGYALNWATGPIGWLAFIVIPILILAAYLLRRIWRSSGGEAMSE